MRYHAVFVVVAGTLFWRDHRTGARLGSDIIAVNAVLMTLLTFTAYALDGFAYAVEAHSGQAYGARDGSQLLDVWRQRAASRGL